MASVSAWPLTYFSHKTLDEFDSVILDLQSILSKDYKNKDRLIDRVVILFVERFNRANLLSLYKIHVSDNLVKAVNTTLNYPIDTEMMIRHIQTTLSEGDR
jgi:hypothetical protein